MTTYTWPQYGIAEAASVKDAAYRLEIQSNLKNLFDGYEKHQVMHPLTLEQALEALRVWTLTGLKEANRILADERSAPMYTGSGIRVSLENGEIGLAPYVSYYWSEAEQFYIEHTISLARTGSESFALLGSTLTELEGWFEVTFEEGEDDD